MGTQIYRPVDLSALTGAYKFKGTWNATTNDPALASGVGTQGDVYRVATAGTTSIDGVALWTVGDHIAFNGAIWQKIEGILSAAEIVAALTFTPQDAAAVADAADIRTATDNVNHVTAAAMAAAHAFAPLTDAANIAWSGKTDGFNVKVTLAGNRAFDAPTDLLDGRTYILAAIQDGAGGRTGSFDAIFDFGPAGAPTLSTGAGKVDFVVGTYSAVTTKLRCTFLQAA